VDPFAHKCVWQTMTSVGTPIFVAPEVMKGNRYDSSADSYSFAICLVAMIRAEKDVLEFYFQALRKKMKKKTKNGIGITILNTRMYTKGWRPLLPMPFKKAYPKLCSLIYRCWSQIPDSRPTFDEIVRLLNGDIGEEVKRRVEPEITYLSQQPDAQYQEEMLLEAAAAEGGGDSMLADDDEEEEMDTAKFVTRREHGRAAELHEKAMEELKQTFAHDMMLEEIVRKELQEELRKLREEARPSSLGILSPGRGAWAGLKAKVGMSPQKSNGLIKARSMKSPKSANRSIEASLNASLNAGPNETRSVQSRFKGSGATMGGPGPERSLR